jgi:hypothetical protein
VAYGTERFNPREKPGSGAGLDLVGLMKKLVDRYVVQKLYQIEKVDLAAGEVLKLKTGDQQASLFYISVYSGTLDVYQGEIGVPSGNAIPLTRVTPTGFPVPFAVPPDAYTFTLHAANSTACRACVIATSA